MELLLGLLGALASAVAVVLGLFIVACVVPTLPKLARPGRPSGRTLDDAVGRVDLGQPLLATAPRTTVDQLKPGTFV